METFERALSRLRILIDDPRNYIYEETAEAMRAIDLKKAEMIQNVDEKYFKVISKLKDFKKTCYDNLDSDIFIQLHQTHTDAFDILVSRFENLAIRETVPDSIVNKLSVRAELLKCSIKKTLLRGKNFELCEMGPVSLVRTLDK